MLNIIRFPLQPTQDTQNIVMNEGAKILNCGRQHGRLWVWVQLDNNRPMRVRKVYVAAAGGGLRADVADMQYVGMIIEDVSVWHVYADETESHLGEE
jgi:hypothetical protein